MTLEISATAMGQLLGSVTSATAAGSEANAKPHVATVLSRDPDGTVWVSIVGGAEQTPVNAANVLVEATPGDTVSVTIANGRASITGNSSSPAATGRTVEVVKGIAVESSEDAKRALSAAETAEVAAVAATESAGVAASAADAATEAAEVADSKATSATISANSAQVAANAANFALSDVEKVVGTLEWIAEHGAYSLTADSSVIPGKVYYTQSGDDPDYVYTIVSEPDDADIATYYELHMDESVQNYVASHLWLNGDGLNVMAGASDYRAVLGPDGLKIIDPQGNVVGLHGQVIQLGSTDGVYLEANSSVLSFRTAVSVLSYFGMNDDIWELFIENARIGDMLKFGDMAWIRRANGNMSLKWIGDDA